MNLLSHSLLFTSGGFGLPTRAKIQKYVVASSKTATISRVAARAAGVPPIMFGPG
jgi:hypothetical protein